MNALNQQKKKREIAHDSGGASLKTGSVQMGLKKIFEINVKSATGLNHGKAKMNPMDKQHMRPFFSFDFYTFEYQSPTANGANPQFDVTKHYEVELNQDLMNYRNNQFLKIDFVDDNVDLEANSVANDYIGSARIPLKGMLTQDLFDQEVDITNEKGIQTGKVQIRVAFYKASMRPRDGEPVGTTRIQSQELIKDVVQQISAKLASMTENQDLEMALDPMFMKA